jgi:NitT/TauT family transport system substrate-binding protein
MRIGTVASIATAPIVVPALEGQFAIYGLNVVLDQPSSNSADAMTAVATGHLDMAYVTMSAAVLNAFNGGLAMKIIAAGAAQPSGHGDNAPIVVRTQLVDSGDVKTVADLKGRKVAISGKGVGPEYKMARALRIAGLTPSDVDVHVMPVPEMVAAMSTGVIDAGVLLQPTAAQAVAQGVGTILLDDYDQNGQGGLLVVNSRFLDQHGDAVTNWLEVYLRAIRRLSDGKLKTDDQALTDLQTATNVPPNIIRLSPDPYWPRDGHVLVDSLRDQQEFFISTNSTDYTQPLDIQKFIDYGPVDAALKNVGD